MGQVGRITSPPCFLQPAAAIFLQLVFVYVVDLCSIVLYIKRGTKPTCRLESSCKISTLVFIRPQALTMVQFSGFMVLALTCVCTFSMASACWESPACSDLSSKERMLVRGNRCCHHFSTRTQAHMHATNLSNFYDLRKYNVEEK